MPRKRFYPTDQYPYHIVARSHNKERFYVPLEDMWSLFSEYLTYCSKEFGLSIHSFVMMSNHFHMLATTPEVTLDKIMNYFMREVSRNANRRAGRINQTFGGPYHWSVMKSPLYYHHAYKYVYRNPVQAGICNRAEHYPYSSLQFLLGKSQATFPICDNKDFIQSPFQILKWLNSPFPDDSHWEQIRLALKKQEFAFPIDQVTKEKSSLETHYF